MIELRKEINKCIEQVIMVTAKSLAESLMAEAARLSIGAMNQDVFQIHVPIKEIESAKTKTSSKSDRRKGRKCPVLGCKGKTRGPRYKWHCLNHQLAAAGEQKRKPGRPKKIVIPPILATPDAHAAAQAEHAAKALSADSLIKSPSVFLRKKNGARTAAELQAMQKA